MKRSQIKRKRPMKARPGVRRALDRQASEAWAKSARTKPCAVCGATRAQGHHLIPQQRLRRVAEDTGLDFERIRWDARNRLPLCERHHAAMHSRAHPLSLELVLREVPKFLQFVRELDRAYGDGRDPVMAFVERTYGSSDERRAA